MKKRLWMVIPFAAALALCLGLAVGCGEQESAEHVHEWGEYTVTTAPTCEKAGEHVRTCKICGAEDPVKLMPALGHKYEGVVTTPATCEGEGVMTYTCKNDPSHTYTEKIEPIGHKWKVKRVITEPTCTEKGEQEMVCENDASHTKTMDITPKGHTWSDWEWEEGKVGDCVTDGKRHRECTVCHTPEEEDVIAQGHKYGALTETKPATCTERGIRTSICSVCKQSVDQAIAPLGHQWDEGKITKDPTCEDKGSATYTCSVCKDTKTVEIPATGHKWNIHVDVEPTATAEGKQTATCETCSTSVESTIPYAKGIYRVVVKKLDGKVVRTKKYWDDPATGKYVGTLVSFYNKEGVLVFEKHVDFYDLVKEPGKMDESVEHTPFVEVELPIQDYTVKLGNIPDGYYYQDSYEIKANEFKKLVPDLEGKNTTSNDEAVSAETKATEPVDMNGEAIENGKDRTISASLDITLVSHMSDTKMRNHRESVDGYCGAIREGAVLPDCSWVTTDNQSILLSDLLKEKKLVILDFYFFTCTNCKEIAPYFVEFANAFKDDIAVVCLDILDTSDATCNGIRASWNYPDWFYIVNDSKTEFYMNIEHGNANGRPGVPRQVVIDQGFCVAALHGKLLERTGQALMECLPGYFGKDYETELAARKAANAAQDAGTDTTVMPVMLPERKELFA